ncbi:hypothetical protein MHU86_20964 [Fragilaria crotonensis]|nr:hypothetical protein MHU86_20964 [Fragilaria crotonensis]
MMRPCSLLTFACLLAHADGQSSPSPATPSIISPSLGGFGTCAEESLAFNQCLFSNVFSCADTCDSNGVDTVSTCDDLQASCDLLTCCPACQALGGAMLECVAGAYSCTTVDCGFAPAAPSPVLSLPPFNPAALTFPPFNPASLTFPPFNPAVLSLPPNLPSINETEFCAEESIGWVTCLINNATTCDTQCENVDTNSTFEGCVSFDSDFCTVLTCCDACANVGKAFAACLATLAQCGTDCGSFAPFAPTTVDFPSIVSSLMPIPPGVSMMPIMATPSPVIESPSPTDASTSAPVAAPSSSTTSAPVGTAAPVETTAPVTNTSAPAASPTTGNETTPAPVLGNGTKTPAPTIRSGAFAESTVLSAILAAMMGFAAFYHSVA